MSLEPQEQFKTFLEKSQEVLILIPENPSGDAVGSAWALAFFLEKKNINATVAFSNNLSAKYSFLPKPKNVLNEISGARDFVLSFDTRKNKIVDLKTEKSDDKFVIYLTPEKGSIDPRDFSFILAKFKYDLLVIFDCPDLERLGKIYESNPELFFEVPMVNIDHHGSNENFGQINLVDITASSCSEIFSGFLEKNYSGLADKNIAQCLLTGIIAATESFQKKNTTPRSLLMAANLMDHGANQQEIIRWLYKTHPLHILKLWGRAMAKIKWDEGLKLIWSELTVEDFVQSRSRPNDIYRVLEKLQENYSEGKIFMVVFNDALGSAQVVIKSAEPEIMKNIYALLGGKIRRGLLEISLAAPTLSDATGIILNKLKQPEKK